MVNGEWKIGECKLAKMFLACLLGLIAVHRSPFTVDVPKQAPTTIELSRGANLPGLFPPYWAVEDTTLDSSEADLDQGYAHELYGADGKNILIQFRDLNRAIGLNKKIVSASLVLTLSGPDNGNFAGASEVLLPWHEGPTKTIMQLTPGQPLETGARGAATWRHRKLGIEHGEWERAGAMGTMDAQPIALAKLSRPDRDHIQIEGLAEIVERQYEKPWTNHGFLLRFDKTIELLSSEATDERPKLVLQVEDAPPSRGPDLSVTYIERKPEYERYENEAGYSIAKQDGVDIPVLDHPLNSFSKKWPSDGDDLTYIAHVKNIGDAPSAGFTARWMINDVPGPPTEVNQALKPGEEALVSVHAPYKNVHWDHSIQPISLVIEPKGADAISSNNSLEIQQSALNLGIWVEKSFYNTRPNGFEDWIQQQLRTMNETVFPLSRFSFATDGVTERLRIQRITVVPDGTLQGPLHLPSGKSTLGYDAELGFPANSNLDDVTPTAMIRRIGTAVGLIDFSSHAAPAIKLTDCNRGTGDMFPGLMGEGDTRDESALPGSFKVPYQPYHDQVSEEAGLKPSGLLSASDVGQLMSNIGKRGGFRGDSFYDTPDTTIVSAVDYNGRKLPKLDLTFYQMVNGEFPANAPILRAQTDAKGYASLAKREIDAPQDIQLATGHTLKPSPFGRIDFSGSNRAFLVKAQLNGVTEWSTLKLWHLTDSFHRGQKSVAVIALAFNFPSDPIDLSNDLAKGKMVIDSAGGTSSELSSLISGSLDQEISLPPAGWVELDLGADHTIGEVRLFSKGSAFWRQFDIRAYSAGEKVEQILPWSHELNWIWSAQNRRDVEPGSQTFSIAYRGAARRGRFVRIVNTGSAMDAKLLGIKIYPVK